jgi:hypothetical protein
MLIQRCFLKGCGVKNPYFFCPVFEPNQGLAPEASAPVFTLEKS